MDRITLDQLRQTFIDRHSGWCVSLYMPAHRAGRETEQDPIRFKNLLRQAEERLLTKGMPSAQVRDLLKAPQRLLQDQAFWPHQSDGLAVFFSEDIFHFFRLPIEFAELVVISDRFHVKPLLPLLTSDGTFHILAISQNQLRLLEGTQHTVDEIDLGNVPETFSEALPDGFPEKQLQFHTGTPSGSGNRPAMFHGHDISNDIKNRIRQWFRTIDKEVGGLLSDAQSPLVLAGVDTLFPLYKEVNTYPHLMDEGIPGNPEGMKPEGLHQKAWTIVEPVFKKEREAGSARYRQLAGTRQTTTDVAEAVLAAHHGRIEVLFVAVDVQGWGRFDPEKDRVDVHESPEPGDEDLLDLSAIQTLLKGGTVYAVPPEGVPDQALVAAVLRY
jgi:Bacterial archaeo-eukaryotic release factor family 7